MKDFIEIIAPSSSCPHAANKLKLAQNILHNKGFRNFVDSRIFSENELSFFASGKKDRSAMLKNALLNENVGILWAFRGGYGCSDIIFDLLSTKPTSKKTLIGYSDITAMHALFNQEYNLPTIHAPVLTSLLDKQNASLDLIIDVLTGKEAIIKLDRNIANRLKGEVRGGNLTVYCNLLGTKLQPNTEGKILIFEDINEKSYQIHRHLVHLYNAGIFDHPKAVIFGTFTNSDDEHINSIRHFASTYLKSIPTYWTNEVGHGDKNYPVIFGHDAMIMEDRLIMQSPFKLV